MEGGAVENHCAAACKGEAAIANDYTICSPEHQHAETRPLSQRKETAAPLISVEEG